MSTHRYSNTDMPNTVQPDHIGIHGHVLIETLSTD